MDVGVCIYVLYSTYLELHLEAFFDKGDQSQIPVEVDEVGIYYNRESGP